MFRRVCCLILLLGCGTKPNPHSCADGICNDQSLPFCDVEGKLGGEPNECIAVSCTPMEHVACRGDQAIRCNQTGNNYDIVLCERGCDEATGCQGCATDNQCSNPTAVCDTTSHSCRGCTSDGECASRVCDVGLGSCVVESQIVYASPLGSTSGACSLSEPCSLAHAASVAFMNPSRSTVRMLPGVYTDNWLLSGTGKILIVGTGATHQNTFYMDAGEVTIRGLVFEPVTDWLAEGQSSPALLTLRDVSINAGTNRLVFSNTVVKMTGVTIRSQNSTLEIQGTAGAGVTLEADQSRFICGGALCEIIPASGQEKTVKIVNSIFEDWTVRLRTADAATSSSFTFAFDTFYSPGATVPPIDCSGSGNWIARFENNIINSGSPDSVAPTVKCTINHNVIFPQTTAIPGTNNFMSPQFTDITNRDLHIKATSPALDAAVPSTGLDPAKDFEGTARPQGVAKDIGAYERKP
jgi:hypothetical protein